MPRLTMVHCDKCLRRIDGTADRFTARVQKGEIVGKGAEGDHYFDLCGACRRALESWLLADRPAVRDDALAPARR